MQGFQDFCGRRRTGPDGAHPHDGRPRSDRQAGGSARPAVRDRPLVNGDYNQHSFDENIRIGHYLAGIRAFTEILRSPY
jgi:hypothetical protein